MGSASCRLTSPKGQKPPLGNYSPVVSDNNSLTKRRRLRRTLSKAKDALHQHKTSRLSKGSLESDNILGPQNQISIEDKEASRPQSRHSMEIIEIPDDVIDNEIISLGSRSGERNSSVSTDLEYISNSSSHLEREVEDLLSERPFSPARASNADDDEFWGYEVPRPRPVPEPDWEKEILGADVEVATALRRFGQREPDWREFLQDNSPVPPEGRGTEYATAFVSGHESFEDAIPPNLANANIDHKVECVDDVLAVFPDICRDYVSELYETGVGEIAEQLVAHILDKLDSGSNYPKAKDKLKTLKRKRELDEDEEAVNKYGSVDRENGGHDYFTLTRAILSAEFLYTPMSFIDSTLNETRRHLFPAYLILEEAERTWDRARPPYNKIKKPRVATSHWTPEFVEATLSCENSTADTMLALRELQAVRRVRKKADDKRQAERQAQLEEEENVRRAEADGTMLECGCCFSDYPLNRMVNCDSDRTPHFFCRGCARQTAETEIGNSRYKIKCMSMDGCDAGFSRDMKAQFLDEKTSIALDRNEQEEMLRLAGIENLASCPFCPFAAEYPPVEEDREFRCQAPDCEKISCRLCKLESHIPKTCEETAKENGLSIRRQIEEAMSAALIRRCNKCGTPFVKEEGCNKMTCTRSGCYNVQCYVCSKSCSYDHFNDRSRGGKPGNCPLFESVEERHQEEVKKAEKEALDRVRAEHPEYTEEDLRVKVSENVRKDEERRKANDPRNLPPGVAHRMPPAGVIHVPQQVGEQVRVRVHGAPRDIAKRHAERHIPPQAVAQDIGPWPLPRDPPRWHYDRENAPPPLPGAGRKAEVPEPVPWHEERQPAPRPLRMVPEPPEWLEQDLQQPGPAPGIIPEPPPFFGYRPDLHRPIFNEGMDVMLGLLQPANAPDFTAGALPLEEERGPPYMPHFVPAPGANNDILYRVYDGGPPNMALELDQLREMRLRHQERAQNHVSQQQRPVRPARGQPVPPQAGIVPLRLSRGKF